MDRTPDRDWQNRPEAAGPTPPRWPRNEPGFRARLSTLGDSCETGGTTMKTLRILGLAVLSFIVMAQGSAMGVPPRGRVSTGVQVRCGRRRDGGAETRGVRRRGQDRAAVTEARRRSAMDRETQAADTVPGHRRIPGGPGKLPNFSARLRRRCSVPPRPARRTKPSGEAVIRKNGKPIVGDPPSPPRRLESRRRAPTTSPPSAGGMGKPTRCSSPPRGIADKEAGLKKLRAGLGELPDGHQV